MSSVTSPITPLTARNGSSGGDRTARKETVTKTITRVVRKSVDAPETLPFLELSELKGNFGIQEEMEVIGVCPEKNMRERVPLLKGMKAERVAAAICTATTMTGGLQNMILYRVDSLGWSVEISQSSSIYQSEEELLSVVDIHHGDVIEVRRLGTGAVGGKFRLNTLVVDKSNEYLTKRVHQMSRTYKGYRKIRGDGNCYYRSICFGLLEQIIEMHNRHAFGVLYRLFKNVSYTDRLHTTEHRELLAALASASGDS